MHGGWHLWEKIDVQTRAELMAHELHKSKREAYYRERLHAHAKTKTKDKKFNPSYDPLDAIKRQWGVKY